jgi:two-component system invasion response regulator UvrY
MFLGSIPTIARLRWSPSKCLAPGVWHNLDGPRPHAAIYRRESQNDNFEPQSCNLHRPCPWVRCPLLLLMKILVTDDHAVLRRGLMQILEDGFGKVQFGEAANTGETIAQVEKQAWDLVALDITMPGRSGLDALKEIKSLKPATPVLVLSVHSEDQFAVRALKAGAGGYLNKDSAPEELVKAARKVMSGGRYVSDSLAEKLANTLEKKHSDISHHALSDREFQVLLLIGSGKTVSEIGVELSLSVKTVSTYRTRILQKMSLNTNAEMTRYCFENKLVQ